MSRRIINVGGSFLSIDPDALAFITNWEANTEVTMQQRQRNAVNELYLGLKGQNTTNSTDFWTDAVEREAVLFPLVPLTDTTANALAYELDVFSNGVFKGNFNNFLDSDFTINGVTGQTGATNKHFNILKRPIDYLQNDVMLLCYNNDNGRRTQNDAGASDASDARVTNWRLKSGAGDQALFTVNQTGNTVFVGVDDILGFNAIQRTASNQTSNIIKNEIISTNTINSSGRSSLDMIFHAWNRNGAIQTPSGRRFCGYGYGLASLKTQEEIDDFNELIQRFNDNIVPDGR
jgi:hypothetical protein